MKRRAFAIMPFAIGVLAFGFAAATPARADLAVVKFERLSPDTGVTAANAREALLDHVWVIRTSGAGAEQMPQRRTDAGSH